MNANVGGLIEYVRVPVQYLVCGFDCESEPSVVLRDRSAHSHLAKCSIGLSCSDVLGPKVMVAKQALPAGTIIDPAALTWQRTVEDSQNPVR